MPVNPRPGKVINGYEIVRILRTSGFATSCEARKAGRKAFLKQYKSPTIKVKWYKDYIRYEDEVKRRIETSRAKDFCVGFGEFFEAKTGETADSVAYFQSYEFVEGGTDLESVVSGKAKADFAQRCIM